VLAQAIELYQQRVDIVLKNKLEQLDDCAPELKDAMTYGALMGGKRIRPFLVYAIGQMLKVPLEKLDNAAAAIECIHAYSLIHDDLPAMDDDDLRRGKPTVHIAFNEAQAILAGDALQSLAFELMTESQADTSPTQQLHMVKVLAKAAGYQGMCGGQAIDLAATNKAIDLAQLTQLHNKKTGALISCAVELAIILADASPVERAHLAQFSHALGLAFQVQDDILDVTVSTQELGKPQGSDEQANKSTFPKLLGLAAAQAQATELVQQALSALEELPYNTQLIADFARYIITRRL
jgi:farnesyl diphosphate synthase